MREKLLDETPGWGGQSPGQRLCAGVGEDIYKEPLGPQTETQTLSSGQGWGKEDTCRSPDHSCGRIHGNGRSHTAATSDSHQHVQSWPAPGTERVALHDPLKLGGTVRPVLANELHGQE